MTMTPLQSLFAHKAWINNDLFNAVASINPQQHPEAVHTATRTLNHAYVVDRIFRAHLLGEPHGYKATNTDATPELGDLQFAVAETDAWFESYVATLTEAQLNEVISFRFTDGDTGTMTRQEILFHVITHGASHRGNVGQVMKSMSITPPRDLYNEISSSARTFAQAGLSVRGIMKNQELLVAACLAMVLLTFAVAIRLLICRTREMKQRRVHPQAASNSLQVAQKLQDVQASDNFKNLFEVPVLFYALIGIALAMSHTPVWLVWGAWFFVLLRLAHSLIQCTYNKVMHRFAAFMLSLLVVVGLWTGFFPFVTGVITLNMSAPQFFKDSQSFRKWLEDHSSTAPELLVGFHKVGSGLPSMSWPESVDEALCFGWIDGVRRRIDDLSYSIRFTPRKTTSVWSTVNIEKYEAQLALGKMTPAGEKAFSYRRERKSGVYSYEKDSVAALSDEELKLFTGNLTAFRYFEATPPGYRRVILHWITSAKRAQTRASRLDTLLKACAEGQRLR